MHFKDHLGVNASKLEHFRQKLVLFISTLSTRCHKEVVRNRSWFWRKCNNFRIPGPTHRLSCRKSFCPCGYRKLNCSRSLQNYSVAKEYSQSSCPGILGEANPPKDFRLNKRLLQPTASWDTDSAQVNSQPQLYNWEDHQDVSPHPLLFLLIETR